jgi:hypothetical protein
MVGSLQHLSTASIFRRTDNPLLFEQIDELRRFAVADAQPALQQRR